MIISKFLPKRGILTVKEVMKSKYNTLVSIIFIN